MSPVNKYLVLCKVWEGYYQQSMNDEHFADNLALRSPLIMKLR